MATSAALAKKFADCPISVLYLYLGPRQLQYQCLQFAAGGSLQVAQWARWLAVLGFVVPLLALSVVHQYATDSAV